MNLLRLKNPAYSKKHSFKHLYAFCFAFLSNIQTAHSASTSFGDENPFERAKSAITTFLENLFDVIDVVVIASIVGCLLPALWDRFNKPLFIKVCIISAVFQSISWIAKALIG